nr:immunoglobulin light chain junction region [Macaca mulatta]
DYYCAIGHVTGGLF